MKTTIALIAFLCTSLSLMAVPTAISSPLPSDAIVGTWDYSVDTPNGTYKGQFVFTKTEDGYSGKMVAQGAEVPLKSLAVDGNHVSFSLNTEGYFVNVKVKLENDVLDGKIEVEYEYFPIKGKRVE